MLMLFSQVCSPFITPPITKLGVGGGGGGLNHCFVSESIFPGCYFLDSVFWTPQPYLNKHSVVVHYHQLEFQVKKLVCYFQGQGHRAFYSNYDCLTECLCYIFWTNDSSTRKPSLRVDHHCKSKCPVKHWVAVFKVKVTAQVKNFC